MRSMTNCKPIVGITTRKDGIDFWVFPSMSAACRTLADRDSKTAHARVRRKLKECCENKRKSYFGMEWSYGI